jgi:hypothetical protein
MTGKEGRCLLSYCLWLILILPGMTLPLCAAELSADTIYSMTAKLEQEFNGAYAQQNPTAGEFKEYKMVARQGQWSIV